MQAAPVSDYPFANNIFWCNVFPPEVYTALDELWVPSEFMHKDKRTGHSKLASHKNADQRYKTTLDDYLRIKDAKGARYAHAALRAGNDTLRCSPVHRGAALCRVGSAAHFRLR